MTNLRRFLVAGSLATAALAAGCAQEVGDVDRIDDNLLEKSMFDGQWYMLQTVIDTNATAEHTFAGLQGPLERVHFEFSEDYLIARRVHEDIIGLDTVATNITSQPQFDGNVVAAYSVMHTDVQRQYNSSTGEQSNVLTENASDRRWYERDYIRANWNDNRTVTGANGEFASWIEDQGSAWITIPAEQSQGTLHTETDDAGVVNYFDFVTTYIGGTDWWSCFQIVGFPGWGVDCGTEEMVVRTSFVKLTEAQANNLEHVARRYDDHDMNLFGFFQKINCYYDERYDCTDYSRVELATIHDIWDNDFDSAGRARPYADRTPKPIVYYLSEEYPTDLYDEAYEIAEQYSYAFRRTVAAAQGKQLSDIPRMFYACLNPGSTDATVPQELLDTTYNPVDRARLQEAYAASAEGYQLGHCKRGGDVKNTGDIRYNFFTWRTDPAAPWYGYGPSAADPLTGQIIQAQANFNGGHLSRDAERILNLVKIIEGDLTPEEYGYGVNIQDYYEQLRQQADYDLYFGADLIVGDDDKALELQRAQQNVVSVAARDAVERNADRALVRELLDRPYLRDLLSRPVESFRLMSGRQEDPLARAVGTPVEQILEIPEFIDHMTMGAATTAAGVTDVLRNPVGRNAAEVPSSVMEQAAAYASPLQVARMMTTQRRADRLRDRLLGDDCVIMADDFDRQIIGFAEEMYRYKAQLEADHPELTAEEVDRQLWLEVRGRIYIGIESHEIGHTVGLRHNFVGTADSMNYFPQYWALRQETFDEQCAPDEVPTFSVDGFATGDVAPTLCSGTETSAQRAERSAEIMARLRSGTLADGTQVGSINHYEYSTVMDYHGDFNGRQGGLGLYDYAAVAYGYGELLEVFDEAPHRLEVDSRWNQDTGSWTSTDVTRHPTELVQTMKDVENWTRYYPGGTDGDSRDDDEFDYPWTYWHYSVLPIMFWESNPTTIDTNDLAQARHPGHIDFTGIGNMSGMYSRKLVSASECQGATCQYCDTDADCAGVQTCYRSPLDPRQTQGITPGYCATPSTGAPLLTAADVVVPYRFCEDYLRGSSATCNIFDGGADELEIVTRLIEDYKNYYPISSFRRGRPAFGLDLWSYISRDISYTFQPAVQQYQYWLLSAANRGPEWYAAERGGLSATLAMEDALNFVAGTLTTPSIGTYAPDDEDGGVIVNIDADPGYRAPNYDPRFGGVAANDYIDLSIADGARYQYSQFHRRREDDEAGYHYFYQYEVLSHFWSKYAALISFMDGSVDIIGADTDSDSTAFYIPPYLAFPSDIGNFVGGIMAGDIADIGMCATRNPDGKYDVAPIELLRSSSYRCAGQLVNPYTTVYGNRDYNMQLYSTVFAAANFSANLDYSWLDQSSVYLWGRGETPAIVNDRDERFDWVTYTDEFGTTYAARILAEIPNPEYDPTDVTSPATIIPDPDDYNSSFGPNVGYRMVQRAIDLQVELDAALELEDEAKDDPSILLPDRDSSEISQELDNHIENIRFLVETNKVFQW